MSPERWQQIARLFDEVLEREPQQRAAWLNEACAGDTALRDEVAALLAASEKAGEFMRQPAFELEAKQAASQTTLPAGQRIAHFEVLAPLGAGAMGEVYLARDTRLDRKVALKLLPLRFTMDESRLRRFAREARAASALNHQNIITVFEIGQEPTPQGPRHYIVTEYVEGETLRERLSDGALPIKEALAIANQIAAALAVAHANGIIHRDIKPENVMVRPDGVVKVLDFGIAKLTESAAHGSDNPVPANHHSTVQGTVVGTPGYMSPEQARGLDVDARTDIFSLGVVLYEMLAGQLPFRGTTNADVIVALLEHEPNPITVCAPEVPDELEEIVTQALAKDCGQRYQTIQDLQAALHIVEQQLEQGGYQGRAFSLKRTLRRFVSRRARSSKTAASPFWVGLALCGVIAALVVAGYFVTRPAKQARLFEHANWKTSQPVRHKVGAQGYLSRVFFSPDSNKIAYHLQDERGSYIWVKDLNSSEAHQLTDGKWTDYHPVWAPDGQKLAFFSNRENKRGFWAVSASGGVPTLLCEIGPEVYYLVGWFRDNRGERLYFVPVNDTNNLQVVDLQTRAVSQLTRFTNAVNDFSVSPDERQIAYSQRAENLSQIMIQPLPTGSPNPVAGSKGSLRFPVWFPDSQTLAYVSNSSGIYQIYYTSVTGQAATQLTLSESNLDLSAVSPDGNKLIGVSRRQPANIWALDLLTGTESAQTSELSSHFLPAVSLCWNSLAYLEVKDEIYCNEDIFIKSLAQQNQPTKLTQGCDSKWSPDGSTLLFFRLAAGKQGLWTLDLASNTVRELVPDNVSANQRSFVPLNLGAETYSWSSDGNTIAYCTRVAGVTNLWMMAKDGSAKRQVTTNNASQTRIHSPIWSPDNSLAYFSDVKDAVTNERLRSLSVYRAGKIEEVFHSRAYFKLIGWSASSQEIFLARGIDISEPKEFELLSVIVASGNTKPLARLPAVYLNSIKLSTDRRYYAFVSRKNGKDNIEVLPATGGLPKKRTNNHDPDVYYSGLTWDPSGKRLFYSKQQSWITATMIERLP